MTKKKGFEWFGWAKTYWPAVAILSFVIGFAAHLQLVWAAPKAISDTKDSVSKLSETVNSYITEQQEEISANKSAITAEKAANEQRDKLIQMLAEKAVKGK